MARDTLFKAFGIDVSHYKKADFNPNEARDVLQVIGAGLPRTGTSSLKAALEILRFDPCHHMSECVTKPGRSDHFTRLLQSQQQGTLQPGSIELDQLKTAMRGYRATVDAPTSELYLPLLTLYPHAKVILSVRTTDAAWWASFTSTLGVQLTTRCQILAYPVGFLWSQEQLMMAMVARWRGLSEKGELGPVTHKLHNEEVKAKVPKERLLVWNVKEGWGPLCGFLGVEVPDQPFPNMNDAASVKRAMIGAQVMGACAWLLYLGLAGASVLLLFRLQMVLDYFA